MASKRKPRRQKLEVNVPELCGIVDTAVEHPISPDEAAKLKTAIQAMADQIAPFLSTEKSSEVIPDPSSEKPPSDGQGKPRRGHGRNGAADYTGAARVSFEHPELESGWSGSSFPGT